MGKTIWEIFPGLGLRFYPGKEDRHVGHASASSLLLFLFMPKMCYVQTVQGKEEKKEKKALQLRSYGFKQIILWRTTKQPIWKMSGEAQSLARWFEGVAWAGDRTKWLVWTNPARNKFDRRLTEGKGHGNHGKELISEVGLLIPKSPLIWLLHNGNVAIVPGGGRR